MLKIGVLGSGKICEQHIKILKDVPNFELIGYFNTNDSEIISENANIKKYDSINEIISVSDALDFVCPSQSFYEIIVQALKDSKHIFLEKPISYTSEELNNLTKLTQEANATIQIGFIERFNPAFVVATEYIDNPMFIEIHRLTDCNKPVHTPVVLDLMINDIDLVLSMVKSNLKKISASGINIINGTSDIASVRLEFDNGCVANLTASRISLNKMQKARIFQKNAYISIDFIDRETNIIRLQDINTDNPSTEPEAINIIDSKNNGSKSMSIEKLDIAKSNTLKESFSHFHECILENSSPLIGIEDGYHTINVAHQIMEKMRLTSNQL